MKPLQLTYEERDSALKVIDMLLDQAAVLPGASGVVQAGRRGGVELPEPLVMITG